MGNGIDKLHLRKIFSLSALTVGGILLAWFSFYEILLYMGARSTVYSDANVIILLVLGIVITIISYITLKWDDWHIPQL